MDHPKSQDLDNHEHVVDTFDTEHTVNHSKKGAPDLLLNRHP